MTSQAARRSWRIGQTNECRTYYLYYADTMEAQAIDLISRKQAAAALLGGDADGGELAQLAGGSNSLLAELAKAVAEDERVVDATQLFRHKAQQSEDFTSGWAANMAEAGQPEEPVSEEAPQNTSAMAVESATEQEHVKPVADGPPSKMFSLYKQYRRVKQQFPQALLALLVGDTYEMFGDDAQTLARELDVVLTSRLVGAKRVPVAGFAHHTAEDFVARLMAKGHHVALVEHAGGKWLPRLTSPQPRTTASSPKNSKVPAEQESPHADLVGRMLIDPQQRRITVVGPAQLFAATDVEVMREGKTYCLRAEKVRGFTPVAESNADGEEPQPLTADEAYYAELADRMTAGSVADAR